MKRLPVNDPEFLPRGEAAFLEGLAASCPDPATVLELGTGKGNGTTAIAYGLALHANWRIYSVDVGECVEGRQRIENAGIPHVRCHLTRATTATYARSWDETTDLLYVDADHTYVGVVADIAAFAPHVRAGGIIAFDDYCETHHGVMRAVDEWMALPHWLFLGRVGRLIAFVRQG